VSNCLIWNVLNYTWGFNGKIIMKLSVGKEVMRYEYYHAEICSWSLVKEGYGFASLCKYGGDRELKTQCNEKIKYDTGYG